MMIGMALSPKHPTNEKIAAANTPGKDKGRVTRRKVLAGGAPNIQLAWMRRRSIPASDNHSGKIMNGMYEVTRPINTGTSLYRSQSRGSFVIPVAIRSALTIH